MNLKNLLSKLDTIAEAANPAQQAAIAINMKKHHKKPKTEGSMSDAEEHSTGPKFPGYWKGTDPASQSKNKMVGGAAESIIKDLEKALVENPRTNAHSLMREFQEFKLDETFNSKQEVIDHFVRQGKPAAAGAAAWERGWRGPKIKTPITPAPKSSNTQQRYWWQDKEELEEYGGYGGYGPGSQAPTGTTDPEQEQAKIDAQQIKNSTNTLASTLNQQGAAQPLNKAKFSDVMTKLDDKPNSQLSAQELQQVTPMAVAASKALQNPQTATQMKQLISKSDMLDKQKDQKVQQAQQQVGTNTQQPGAGQTK